MCVPCWMSVLCNINKSVESCWRSHGKIHSHQRRTALTNVCPSSSLAGSLGHPTDRAGEWAYITWCFHWLSVSHSLLNVSTVFKQNVKWITAMPVKEGKGKNSRNKNMERVFACALPALTERAAEQPEVHLLAHWGKCNPAQLGYNMCLCRHDLVSIHICGLLLIMNSTLILSFNLFIFFLSISFGRAFILSSFLPPVSCTPCTDMSLAIICSESTESDAEIFLPQACSVSPSYSISLKPHLIQTIASSSTDVPYRWTVLLTAVMHQSHQLTPILFFQFLCVWDSGTLRCLQKHDSGSPNVQFKYFSGDR